MDSEKTDGKKHRFRGLNAGFEFRDMFAGMESIQRKAIEAQNEILERTAKRMIQLMQCIELREWSPSTIHPERLENIVDVTDNFRSHPKAKNRRLRLPSHSF